MLWILIKSSVVKNKMNKKKESSVIFTYCGLGQKLANRFFISVSVSYLKIVSLIPRSLSALQLTPKFTILTLTQYIYNGNQAGSTQT